MPCARLVRRRARPPRPGRASWPRCAGRLRRPGTPDESPSVHRLLVRATLAGLRRPAVVSHQSAAVLHGLPLWDVPLDRVHITRRPRAWNDTGAVLLLPRRPAAGRRDRRDRRAPGDRPRPDGARPRPVAAARGRRRRAGRRAARRAPRPRRSCARGCSTSPGPRQPQRGAGGHVRRRSQRERRASPAAGSILHRWGWRPSALQFEVARRAGGLVGRDGLRVGGAAAAGRVRRTDQVRASAPPGPGPGRRRVRGEAPRGRDPRRGLGRRPLGVGGPAACPTAWPRASGGRWNERSGRDDPLLGCCSRFWSPAGPQEREQHPESRRGSEREVLQHLGDQRGDRRALRAGQRHVREQRVALERLDDRGDAVVPADPQVVPLRDVVGEDDPRARCRAGRARSAARRARATAPRRRSRTSRAATGRGCGSAAAPRSARGESISSMTAGETSAPRVSKTACAQGDIFSFSPPGR